MSKFSFEEMGAVTVSFAADTGVKGGQVLKVTEDGTVVPARMGTPSAAWLWSPEMGPRPSR